MKLFISGYGKMGRMIEKIILDRGLDYAGWTEAVTETDPALAKECVCIPRARRVVNAWCPGVSMKSRPGTLVLILPNYVVCLYF